jgi:hypothetical protein
MTGITYNNHLYIDMQSLAQRAKISYKTVQRLVLKLKTINDRNSTYLLIFNSPNKNFISEIFLEKQKRKLVNKNQFSLLFDVFQKSETNKKTNEFETINNLNKSLLMLNSSGNILDSTNIPHVKAKIYPIRSIKSIGPIN